MNVRLGTAFRERRVECWNYPAITAFDSVKADASYLSFLDEDTADRSALRVYVHIPFCRHLCSFCPYFKHSYGSVESDYRRHVLEMMVREMALYGSRANVAGRELSYVYFGGGDPAVLPVDELRLIWSALKSSFNWADSVEITVEGTAGSLLDEEKLSFFSEQGVDRLSFGIQTFDEGIRRQVNLRPTLRDIDDCISAIRSAGIGDVSVDMIYGFPTQSSSTIVRDLELVSQLPVTYIDCYSLNLYPNTKYMSRVTGGAYGGTATATREVEYSRLVHEWMEGSGFQALSSVSFSRATKEMYAGFMHTQRGKPSIGIGPSARSSIEGRNYRNCASLTDYVSGVGAGRYPIEAATAYIEEEVERLPYVMFPILLQLEGEDVESGGQYDAVFERLVDDGYARSSGDCLELTREGRVWAGNIQRLFFSERERAREVRSLFESLRSGKNPYNEDRMGVPLTLQNRRPSE